MNNLINDVYKVVGKAPIQDVVNISEEEKEKAFSCVMNIITEHILETDIDNIYNGNWQAAYDDEQGMFLNDNLNLLAIPQDSHLYDALLRWYGDNPNTLLMNVEGALSLSIDDKNFYWKAWLYSDKDIEEKIIDALVGLENFNEFSNYLK